MASKILKNIHETAKGLTKAGVMDVQTMREFDALCLPENRRYTALQIKRLREREHVSQAVFANYIHTSPSTVRSWEQGDKTPRGPSLTLLNLIDRKGLAVLE